jgi:hypothetical protein
MHSINTGREISRQRALNVMDRASLRTLLSYALPGAPSSEMVLIFCVVGVHDSVGSSPRSVPPAEPDFSNRCRRPASRSVHKRSRRPLDQGRERFASRAICYAGEVLPRGDTRKNQERTNYSTTLKRLALVASSLSVSQHSGKCGLGFAGPRPHGRVDPAAPSQARCQSAAAHPSLFRRLPGVIPMVRVTDPAFLY